MKKLFLKAVSALLVCSSLVACSSQSTDSESGESSIVPDTAADTTPVEEPTVEKQGTAWFTTPAIPADVGQTVCLKGYDVQFDIGKTTSRENINWSSDEIEIDEDYNVTPTQNGVYTLVAQGGGRSKNIYLVVKAPDESEYVLYENDFESGRLDGITIVEKTNGTTKAENGKMILSAPGSGSDYVRVLLPDFIGEFGDYKITANATITKKADTSRWMSLMYRVQNNDFPYYQLCVRANGASELAYRTKDKSWDYFNTAPYSESIDESKFYEFSLDVHGYYASGSINGNKVVETTDGLKDYPTGRVGFQVCGTEMAVEDVKVVVNFYEPEVFILEKGYTNVRDIDTMIALNASIITEITSAEILGSILDRSPTGAIMTVSCQNDEIQLVDNSGNKIATLQEALDALDGRVIPIFRPVDKTTAEKTGKYLKDNKYVDVMVIGDGEIIKAFRSAHEMSKSILDLTDKDVSNMTLSQIRTATNETSSRICLLPSSMATTENTSYLNALAMTVWYEAEKNDKVELFKLITSGANGIITTDRKLLEECMEDTLFARGSLVRPVQIIAHRGMPYTYAENSVYGALMSIEAGATAVENDVYITKDDVLVVMHDDTLDRTTNGVGKIEEMTYAELSKYVIDYPEKAEHQPIPTLEDYFKAFKGKNANLFIEIKSKSPKIAQKLKELIDEYDMIDQCCVISFIDTQVRAIRKEIPGISCGFLNNSLDAIDSVYTAVSKNDSTYNPAHAAVNEKLMKQLAYRGISSWPWTISDTALFSKFYLMGTWGITTNRTDYASNHLKFLTPNDEYTLSSGSATDAKISAVTYKGEEIFPSVTMHVIDGNDTVKYENGTLTATEKGTSYVIFRAEYKVGDSTRSVHVYSQPVTITVN